MNPSKRKKDTTTAESVLLALKRLVPPLSCVEFATEALKRHPPKDDLTQESFARYVFFENILALPEIPVGKVERIDFSKLSARLLEYYALLTGFRHFVPVVLSKVILSDLGKEKYESILLEIHRLIFETPAQKIPSSDEGTFITNTAVPDPFAEDNAPTVVVHKSTIEKTNKDKCGKASSVPLTRKRSRNELTAQLISEVAAEQLGSNSVDKSNPMVEKQTSPSKPKNRRASSAQNPPPKFEPIASTSADLPSVPQDPWNDTVIGPLQGELQDLTIAPSKGPEGATPLDPKSQRFHDYRNTAARPPRVRNMQESNAMRLHKSAALAGIADQLREKTSTPDAEAPTVKAKTQIRKTTMSYTISEDDLLMLRRDRADLAKEEIGKITSWLEDGLQHATGVPDEMSIEDLIQHIPPDFNAGELAILISKANNSMILLRAKNHLLDPIKGPVTLSETEIAAADILSSYASVDSLVGCVGPVIDYLHSCVEETRANYEAPRRDLEVTMVKVEEALRNHTSTAKQLIRQLSAVAAEVSNKSLDDLGKVLVRSESNRDITAGSLSISSGYSTPMTADPEARGTIGRIPSTGQADIQAELRKARAELRAKLHNRNK